MHRIFGNWGPSLQHLPSQPVVGEPVYPASQMHPSGVLTSPTPSQEPTEVGDEEISKVLDDATGGESVKS